MPGARDLLMFGCMRLILYWLSEAPEARFHVIVVRRKAESLQDLKECVRWACWWDLMMLLAAEGSLTHV